KVKWCYIGIVRANRSDCAQKRPSARTPKRSRSVADEEVVGLQRVEGADHSGADEAFLPSGGVLGEASDVNAYMKLLRGQRKVSVDDEQLFKAIVEWARWDFFNGTGRVFLSELSKCFENVTADRVFRILKAKGVRFDMPGYPDCEAVYIKL
ncbi:MAG: hypothetical protein QW566_06065, partial [Candidatus Jordarchaeales archaeon]